MVDREALAGPRRVGRGRTGPGSGTCNRGSVDRAGRCGPGQGVAGAAA
jgi:hypothetical protein